MTKFIKRLYDFLKIVVQKSILTFINYQRNFAYLSDSLRWLVLKHLVVMCGLKAAYFDRIEYDLNIVIIYIYV